jgi:cytochrome c oxidase subunit 2
VAVIAIAFFWKYRRRHENQATPFVAPTAMFEVLAISVPLAFFLLWFAIGFRDFVKVSSPPPDAMDVYVQGKQWMWKFAYPEGPNSIGVLHVPANRPVRLLVTSRDVIHSVFVPAFRIKIDALPGRYTEIWFTATKPGRYQILCTEYCGAQHSKMWGEVVVMAPEAFDEWIKEQQRGLVSRQDVLADETGQVSQQGAWPSGASRSPSRRAVSLSQRGHRAARPPDRAGWTSTSSRRSSPTAGRSSPTRRT